MRWTLPLLLVAVLVLLVAAALRTVREGAELRALEVSAAEQMERILRAEERHRQIESPPEPLYATLPQLVEEGLLSGFSSTDRPTVLEHSGYYFQVTLLPAPNAAGRIPRLGQRYHAWGWPKDRRHIALALLYGSNAGYVIQGENGETVGPNPSFPESPIQALEGEQGKGAHSPSLRWTVLENIRDPAGAAPAAPPPLQK
jgi:hypothetical protein